jgi:uncharacterized damage-inducible protein DinB
MRRVRASGSFSPPEVGMPASRCDQYRRWYEYEQDSHTKTIASLRTSQATQGADPGWQRAVDLLAHVAAARRLWLYRLGWTSVPPGDVFPRGVALEHAERELADVEREWSVIMAGLTDTDLDRVFEYASLEGTRFRNRVEDILAQLFGHSWYHRGQIALLVRSIGAEPAATDFVYWTREGIG